MQERAPINEQVPEVAINKPVGTADPTATAIAKRLAEIQDILLDVTKDISNEELAKLRGIKAAGNEKLKQLAAEGKVPDTNIQQSQFH